MAEAHPETAARGRAEDVAPGEELAPPSRAQPLGCPGTRLRVAVRCEGMGPHVRRASAGVVLAGLVVALLALGRLRARPEPTKVLAPAPLGAIPIGADDGAAGCADLEPLRTLIGGADLVVLGEAQHGEALFLRAARFLHDELGFDVFVWEAGMFDPQFTGESRGGDYPKWLFDLLERGPTGLVSDAQRRGLERAFARFPKTQRFLPLGAAERGEDRAVVASILASVQRERGELERALGKRESAFAERTLVNVLALYDWHSR